MPTEAATLERARSFADECCWTVALQVRRLRSVEPEDEGFLFRRWVDFRFLITTLWSLRRAAVLARSVASVEPDVTAAIAVYDAALPGLKRMRDVGEHLDDYALDSRKRHDKGVDRRMLQAGQWTEGEFRWVGESLSVQAAADASRALYLALKAAQTKHAKRPEGFRSP